MNDAVFISDLHLHPHARLSLRYFEQWLDWAVQNTRAVYILGDFFHAWAGDDTLDEWSRGIAEQLRRLHTQGIAVYFMRGNRDFLLGESFTRYAGMQLITEPTILQLGQQRVLLVHGDGYCMDDKQHQWFRRFTRARWFERFFLALPRRMRQFFVRFIRELSQKRRHNQPNTAPPIQLSTLALEAEHHQVDVIIHGHTHQPEMSAHCVNGHAFQHIVLSDWDASPQVLCYNLAKGFSFIQTAYEE